MKGLLVKDLKIVLAQKKFFIFAIGFGAIFAYTNKDVTFAATYIVLLTSMLSLSTLSYDDMDGGMSFLLTLPTTRKIYVLEKYIFTALNLILACVISVVICLVLGEMFGINTNLDKIISSTTGATVGMGLLLSINIPVEIKYGVEKSRTAILISIASVFIIVFGGYKLLTEVFDIDIKGKFTEFMEKLSAFNGALNAILVGILLVILFVILVVSYFFSCRIIQKKEY
ncbi:MAG: ABC-2 transporter permease [Lachnospiraceae bacterium]|nr:ABC-2 transporter permease [Lachnospiraceae bacterium]